MCDYVSLHSNRLHGQEMTLVKLNSLHSLQAYGKLSSMHQHWQSVPLVALDQHIVWPFVSLLVLLYEFDSLCMLQMYDSMMSMISMMSICFRCLGRLKRQRVCSTCRGSNYELCTDLDGFANPYRPMGDTGKSIYISPVAGVILAQSWFHVQKKGNKPGFDMDIT